MLTKPLRLSVAVVALLSIAGLKVVSTSTSVNTYSMPYAEFHPGYAPCSFFAGVYMVEGDCQFFQAAVHLPNGITLDQITIHYYDNNDTDDLTVDFLRTDFEGPPSILYHWTSEGYLEDFRSVTIPVAITINNANYGYFIAMVMPTSTIDLGLTGITLESSYPSFLPSIIH